MRFAVVAVGNSVVLPLDHASYGVGGIAPEAQAALQRPSEDLSAALRRLCQRRLPGLRDARRPCPRVLPSATLGGGLAEAFRARPTAVRLAGMAA